MTVKDLLQIIPCAQKVRIKDKPSELGRWFQRYELLDETGLFECKAPELLDREVKLIYSDKMTPHPCILIILRSEKNVF